MPYEPQFDAESHSSSVCRGGSSYQIETSDTHLVYVSWETDLIGQRFGIFRRKADGTYQRFYSPQEYFGPDGEPHYPTGAESEINQETLDTLKAWARSIPQKHRIFTGHFLRGQHALLDLLAYVPEFDELARNAPMFTWLIVHLSGVLNECDREKRLKFAHTAGTTRRHVLLAELSGLPTPRSVVKTLNKFERPPLGEASVDDLIGIFHDPYKLEVLSHIERPDMMVINDLSRIPRELIPHKMKRNMSAEWLSKLESLKRYMEMQHGNPITQDFMSELQSARNGQELVSVFASRCFLDPPTDGSELLVPLTSLKAMRKEGNEMHNCLSGIAKLDPDDEEFRLFFPHHSTYYYSWRGEERATVSFERSSERINVADQDIWTIREISGFEGNPVSIKTYLNVLREFDRLTYGL